MSKNLVAYFSVSGITESLAKKMCEIMDADLFEIKPVTPYTEADVNWKKPLSRCNKEKVGKKDVPLAHTVDEMKNYDKIFVGFPIWYWNAPNIILTFFKQHDFKHKEVIIFATSGGSNLGKTAQTIKDCVDVSTIIKEGFVINDLDEFKIRQLINI